MRQKRWYPSVAACVAISMAAYYGVTTLPQGTATPALANPEDGAVAVGNFHSEYFGLTLPLPRGWIAGAAGPPPSQFGDYVLGTLVPEGENVGAIVMTAQDMFFAAAPHADAAAMIEDFRRSAAKVPGMQIDREPSEERIGGRALWRVDFSGVGLYRAMLVTDIRCHLVRFNLTAREPRSLESLLRSIDNLSFDVKSDAGSSDPICIKDYATGETIVKKVQPVPVGPTYAPIPVRIIIGADGEVKSIHVMHATVDQRHSIEGAVRQWKFKPYVMKGRAVDVETGLGFRFTLSRS
jgi:hypothetical protein